MASAAVSPVRSVSIVTAPATTSRATVSVCRASTALSATRVSILVPCVCVQVGVWVVGCGCMPVCVSLGIHMCLHVHQSCFCQVFYYQCGSVLFHKTKLKITFV